MSGAGLLDLLQLGSADALDLALTNTVSVENDLAWGSTVVPLERFDGAGHARLQIRRTFLADFILDNTRGPIGCGRLVHRGCQS